ncbi:MAG: pseudouridine synthase, partial [Desulfobulbaceae bacterium]|nr:pseudouridine synthase [Desulfobulbaceae bacterium]
ALGAGLPMTLCDYFSTVTLPQMAEPYPSLLDFLQMRFPHVPLGSWEMRIAEGKVIDGDGRPVTFATSYVPGKKIHYFREVTREPVIPFAEKIVFQNDELLVACKPHFLPVVPAGPYVNECLLHRLKKKTGNSDLVPLHRIDRETAGIVLFSANRETRGLYHDLFMHGQVEKNYQAVADCSVQPLQAEWIVANRLKAGHPWFRMQTVPGPVNSRSRIRLLERQENRGRFLLQPETGKKHQLRVHLSGLGFGIINDRYYPDLLPEVEDDFHRPLQLLAETLRFRDPVTGKKMEFGSDRRLLW